MKREKENFNKFVINKFIEYGLHLGDLKTFWHPTNKSYFIGTRNNFCVFDLNLTYLNFRRALKFLTKIVLSGQKILFFGGSKGAEKEFFLLCQKHNHYIVEKWVYGFFTNYQKNLIEKYCHLPKVEEPPALIFIFDLSKNKAALEEGRKQNIPVMAFVSSGESTEGIDYPIPASVNSWKGGLFIFNLFRHLFKISEKQKFFKK
jgi:small subunit ribosomal protein S2